MASEPGTIVVVEDDPHIADLIDMYLRRDGHRVVQAADGEGALRAVERERPRMVILDVGLPGPMDGFEVCRRIRAGSGVPVMILTARGEEIDRVLGFELGADDYVTKPFSPRELVARINAVLRRSGTGALDHIVEFDALKLDQQGQRITVEGQTVPLGPTEYRMLEFFMTHPERVFSRDQLLDRLWGGNVYVEERTIDVHVRRLRKSLEKYGMDRLVQTVRGSGYRFSAKAE